MLTLGYAVAIIAFIRVGEKLLQRFGARKPMIWGCLITGLSILFLLPANVMLSDYKILAIIGYTLYGVGWPSMRRRRPMPRSLACPRHKPDPDQASTRWHRPWEPRSGSPFRQRSSPH